MRYLVGTNIKMYLTALESLEWIKDMDKDVPETDLVDVALFPTFPALFGGLNLVTKSNIGLGAQNMGFLERGALTGEISVLSLKEMSLTYIELGHHERRLYFNETDGMVRQKIELALAHGLKALVCVGEDEAGRAQSSRLAFEQASFLTRDLSLGDPSRLIIAYEPRWAIGVDKPASPEHAEAACQAVRKALISSFGEGGKEVRVIYGGSVRLEDAKDFLAMGDINGLFIGRAALDTGNFAKAVAIARDQAAADQAAAGRAAKD
jgi:triosephosphate isomerase